VDLDRWILRVRLEVTDERARNPRLLVGEWLCGEGEREYRDGVERELPGRDRGTLRLLERSFVSPGDSVVAQRLLNREWFLGMMECSKTWLDISPGSGQLSVKSAILQLVMRRR